MKTGLQTSETPRGVKIERTHCSSNAP